MAIGTEAIEDPKTTKKNARLKKNKQARVSRHRRILKKSGKGRKNRAGACDKGEAAENGDETENWDEAEGWGAAWDEAEKWDEAEGWGAAWDEAENWDEAEGSGASKPKKRSKGKTSAPSKDEVPVKRTKITATSAGPPDPIITNEILKYMWYYADMDYGMTGLTLHEQKWGNCRLNVYWSRKEVGVTIKKFQDTGRPKDACHFSTGTCTIASHLYVANLIVCA